MSHPQGPNEREAHGQLWIDRPHDRDVRVNPATAGVTH
jgi:hypothetical protein